MGSSQSVELSFRISGGNADCPVVQAGACLSGQVIVNVKEVICSVPLQLSVSGREATGMKIKSRGKMVFTRVERLLFSKGVWLTAFQDRSRISTGAYAFPFSVMLPSKLPSSQRSPGSPFKEGYEISYRLVVKMGRSYTKELPFIVRSAPMDELQAPRWILPKEFPMKDNGKIVIGAMIQNPLVGRGDNVRIFIACRNDSMTSVKYVEIEIVQFIRYTLGLKQDTKDKYKILKSIKSLSLPPSCKAQSCGPPVGQQSQGALHKFVMKELQRHRDPIEITIPTIAQESFDGTLIKIWHCIKVRFVTGTVRKDDNLIATIPIQIGRTPVRYSTPMSVTTPIRCDVATTTTSSLMSSQQRTTSISNDSVIGSDGSGDINQPHNNDNNNNNKKRDSLRLYHPRRKPLPLHRNDSSISDEGISPKRSESPFGDDVSSMTRSVRSLSSPTSRSRSGHSGSRNALRIYVPNCISIPEEAQSLSGNINQQQQHPVKEGNEQEHPEHPVKVSSETDTVLTTIPGPLPKELSVVQQIQARSQ